MRAGLPKVTTPITLLHGDYSTMGVPAGTMDKMYKAAYATAPSVTIVEIGPSRHFIMLDQPAKFDAALDLFLAE